MKPALFLITLTLAGCATRHPHSINCATAVRILQTMPPTYRLMVDVDGQEELHVITDIAQFDEHTVVIVTRKPIP